MTEPASNSTWRETEELHHTLSDLLATDRRALLVLAVDGGMADEKADTTLDFLIWVHESWRRSLDEDRKNGALTEHTRTMQAVARRMLLIWG